MVVALAQGPRHHLHVLNQYMGGEPLVKEFKGCGLVVGRKKVYSKFLSRLVSRKFFAGIEFLPKEVNIR